MAKILPPSDGCKEKFYARYVADVIAEMEFEEIGALMRLYRVPIGNLVGRIVQVRFDERLKQRKGQ